MPIGRGVPQPRSGRRANRVKGRAFKRPAKDALIGVRVDQRTKYLVELAAATQRISPSRFVDELILKALDGVEIFDSKGLKWTVGSAADQLWAEDEIDRFFTLAFAFPALLSFDQHKLVELIKSTLTALNCPMEPSQEVQGLVRQYWIEINVAMEGRARADRLAEAIRGNPQALSEMETLRAANPKWARDVTDVREPPRSDGSGTAEGG